MGEKRPWWQESVIYEIYVRSFLDTNGDGTGDLPGVTQRLDYLSEVLGVDAIWLTPFYPSPQKDFGYDVADYCAVDPTYGTLDDFDELVAAAHRRGLKVIVDYVPNHTSDEHPWFTVSRSSRDNPKRDWYIWVDPGPEGGLPNNWLSAFGGPAWEWDPHTQQYYLHSFLSAQPDLNWRNPEVEEAMFDVVRFWLERGVDGFRIDVAHRILKDPELRDNPPRSVDTETRFKSLDVYDSQLHVYDMGHPDTHDTYRRLRRIMDAYDPDRPRAAFGEIHIFDYPEWATYYGEELDELHMPFNFHLLSAAWEADVVRAVVDSIEAALPEGAWPNWVLGNHDRSRIATRIGPAQARVAAVLLLTLRGTPTLYYGDELGMRDVPIPTGLAQDPYEHRVPSLGVGRDPERTPMQWTPGPQAGFCPPHVTPWLPVASDAEHVNVAVEQDDPTSMLRLYQRLLRLRRTEPALSVGDYAPVLARGDVLAYSREHGRRRLLVALNLGGRAREVALPPALSGDIVLSTHLGRHGTVDVNLALRPHEAIVVAVPA